MERPFVYSNLAISIDGKIAYAKRGGLRLTGEQDRKMMDRLRAQADAVLVGAGTVRADGYAQKIKDKRLVNKRMIHGLPPHPLNVCISRDLKLPPKRPMFHDKDVECWVFCGRTASKRQLLKFARLAKVQRLRAKHFYPAEVCRRLYRAGVRQLLLEGGGELMFSFLRAHLLDRIYVTVAPLVIGGRKAPSLVGGEGFQPETSPHLALISHRRVGQELYLCYDVKYATRPKR